MYAVQNVKTIDQYTVIGDIKHIIATAVGKDRKKIKVEFTDRVICKELY